MFGYFKTLCWQSEQRRDPNHYFHAGVNSDTDGSPTPEFITYEISHVTGMSETIPGS